MRALVFIAALALATPTWAANDDAPSAEMIQLTVDVCKRTSTAASICAMKHVYNEWMAVKAAKSILDECDWNRTRQDCAAERAYIKQRWGY